MSSAFGATHTGGPGRNFSVSALGAEVKADVDEEEVLRQFKIHIPDEYLEDDPQLKAEPKRKWLSNLKIFFRIFFCTKTPIYLTIVLLGIWICLVIEGANGTFGSAMEVAVVAVSMSLAILLGWLMIRFVVVEIIVKNYFPESVVVGTALDLLDPHLMNLFWSLTIRIFWLFQLVEIVETTNDPVSGTAITTTIGYYTAMLGPGGGTLSPRTSEFFVNFLVLQVVWTFRSLMVNGVMFKFMLDFMMNTNGTVTQYLSTYALLRRLNSQWIRLNDMARVLANDNLLVDRPVLRAVQSMRLPPPVDEMSQSRQLSASSTPQLHRFTSNILEDVNDVRREKRFHVEYDGNGLPSVLTRDFIERSKKEPLLNLLGVQYIKQYSTVLFVGGVRVELTSKSKARESSEKLFGELLQFRNSLQPPADVPMKIILEGPDGCRSIGKSKNVLQDENEPDGQKGNATLNREISECPKSIDEVKSHEILEIPHMTSTMNLGDKQTAAEVAAVISAVAKTEAKEMTTPGLPIDSECLTREILELFLSPSDVELFMGLADPGGYGKIGFPAFLRIVLLAYSTRKKLIRILDAQEGIQFVFKRMVSLLITFLFFLVFLVLIGVNVNTILISGAAVFSSIAVSLSNLYSSFMQSVTLICFLNPYNIGDRVRIDGEILIVKKITTFFTIFESMHAKPLSYSHAQLINMRIMNESRSKVAALELVIDVLDTTSPTKLQVLRKLTETFCYSRPLEFKSGSFSFFFTSIQPGSFLQIAIWITHVESWHNWRLVYSSRSSLFLYVLKICDTLGILYKLPVARWEISNRQNSRPNKSNDASVAATSFDSELQKGGDLQTSPRHKNQRHLGD